MSNKPLPRIPLEVFKKMLETLSLDDLRQLPATKLPREVPAKILRGIDGERREICLLYTSPSPRDLSTSRMPSSA